MSLKDYIARLKTEKRLREKANELLANRRVALWNAVTVFFERETLTSKTIDSDKQRVFWNEELGTEVACFLDVIDKKVVFTLHLNGKEIGNIFIIENDDNLIFETQSSKQMSLSRAIDNIFSSVK